MLLAVSGETSVEYVFKLGMDEFWTKRERKMLVNNLEASEKSRENINIFCVCFFLNH